MLSNDSDSEDELPPGWEERATVDGNVYYVNHFTQGTQWTHPRTGRRKMVDGEFPPGWEKCITEDNKVLFVDQNNDTTTYTDPRLAFATEYREKSQPVRQRFDGSSTALSVLYGRDLRHKRALITGANTGIGYETARSLALHGCQVIFACRDTVKAEKAIQRIREEKDDVECEILNLDLGCLKSVRRATVEFKRKYKSLNLLILNAGVFGVPYQSTEDGLESTFQVNHLSQFYLTILLEECIRNCRNSRVVVVSSESHRFSTIRNVDDLNRCNLSRSVYKYWAMNAYNDSKLCNILFAKQLAERWPEVGVFSCHPGNMVSSDLSRQWWIYRILFAIVRPFTKSLQQAASTTVFCATAPELDGATGIYFNNCFNCEASSVAGDRDLGIRLWDVGKEIIDNVVGEDEELIK